MTIAIIGRPAAAGLGTALASHALRPARIMVAAGRDRGDAGRWIGGAVAGGAFAGGAAATGGSRVGGRKARTRTFNSGAGGGGESVKATWMTGIPCPASHPPDIVPRPIPAAKITAIPAQRRGHARRLRVMFAITAEFFATERFMGPMVGQNRV